MTRLIDADELIKSYLDHNRTEFEIKNCCMANENVIAIINNAPTVELTEGEWMNIDDIAVQCPFCNKIEVIPSKFCRECGAKLDMWKENEE